MGRLTLNVLLSFAQFEREVTGERIRDKIAASKKKGMWMGGNVPLGYDVDERALVINQVEAETVRRIFALYCKHGCVRRVKYDADRLWLQTKRRTTAKGAQRGGTPFSRGHIYRLLSNPIYTGRIGHKGQLYPGQHPALIDDETWTAVQNQLAANSGNQRRRTKAAEPSLLAGLLVDARGERLTPSHAVKKGRRYRYYVSVARGTETAEDRIQGWRLAAQEIEDCVISILVDALTSPGRLLDRLDIPDIPSDQMRRLLGRAARLAATLRNSLGERAKVVRELVERVIVDEKRIVVAMRRSALCGGGMLQCASGSRDSAIKLTAVVEFKRRGAATKMVLPGLAPQQGVISKCDPALVKAIARGRAWFEELAAGRVRSLQELALRDGITRRYIRRLVDLAFLSPQLVEAIIQGRQSDELTATRLTELDLPLDWAEQHRLLAS
jgi:site-specific DNA recombinase